MRKKSQGTRLSANASARPYVIKSYAESKIGDIGALTVKRLKTVDQEFLAAAIDFMDTDEKADTLWFCSASIPMACSSTTA